MTLNKELIKFERAGRNGKWKATSVERHRMVPATPEPMPCAVSIRGSVRVARAYDPPRKHIQFSHLDGTRVKANRKPRCFPRLDSR